MFTRSVIILFFGLFGFVASRFGGHICQYGATSPGSPGPKCISRDNSLGLCAVVQDCPGAHRWSREFHKYYRWGYKSHNVVCCPISRLQFQKTLTTSTTSPETTTEPTHLLPPQRKADIACDSYVTEMPMPISIQIIGGSEAVLGEFPHMVALGYGNDEIPNFNCGGSLISEWYVLTAAHCVVRMEKNPLTVVRIGVVDLEGNDDRSLTDYSISQIITYPAYSTSARYDDIALIRLNASVSLNAFAYPACLNTDLGDPDNIMFITGWGITDIRREAKSQYLMKGNVTSLSISECNANNARKPNPRLKNGLTSAHFCAVDRSFIVDTFLGDSGGPVQLPYKDNMHKIVGITSFGQGVYARVSSYLDWIESIVWP